MALVYMGKMEHGRKIGKKEGKMEDNDLFTQRIWFSITVE
jgi:hypothetical protein